MNEDGKHPGMNAEEWMTDHIPEHLLNNEHGPLEWRGD